MVAGLALRDLIEIVAFFVAKLGGNIANEGLPDNLFWGVAEVRFRGWIQGGADTVEILGNDGVVGTLYDRGNILLREGRWIFWRIWHGRKNFVAKCQSGASQIAVLPQRYGEWLTGLLE